MASRSGALVLALALLAFATGPAGAQAPVQPSEALSLCSSESMSSLTPLPERRSSGLPSDQMCSGEAWLRTPPYYDVTTCDLLGVVETKLGNTSIKPCNTSNQYTLEGGPEVLPNRVPLPASFDDPEGVFAEEGATYHWLFTLLRNIEDFFPCTLGDNGPMLPPAGWELQSYLYLQEDFGSGVEQVNFGSIIYNPGTGQVVVAIRGTQTSPEWLLDWQYNQTTTTETDLIPFPVHAGFARAFDQVWPDVEAALQDLVVGRNYSEVFVVGHSLGAATSTLVSYAAQAYLNMTLEDSGEQVPMLSAVLVAPPNVGAEDFVEVFNAGVNARRIAFQYDIVPQAFCTPSMPTCPGPLGGLFKKCSLVPTDDGGTVSEWNYSQIGGSLTVPGDEMPQNADAWPALATLQLNYTTDFLAATHVCSYKCFLSQFAEYDAALQESNCWLSSQPTGEGSLCPGWPIAYPGMS